MQPNVTRGFGVLEGFLSKQRAKTADQLIPPDLRHGNILDIGCGTYPLFLINTNFHKKYGIDAINTQNNVIDISKFNIDLINYNLETEKSLPFTNDFFHVITMLAVFEHINPDKLTRILNEIYRILAPNGMYILTTPASWTDALLRVLAKLRLVSPDEINDHKDAYSHAKLRSILKKTSFSKGELTLGYFNFFTTLWVRVKK